MDMFGLSLSDLLWVLAAFVAGGVLKGAIGAGVPVIVIPIMTLVQDVRFAVAVFVIPALLSNVWQIWAFRFELLPRAFLIRLAGAASVGAIAGSVLLSVLPADVLTITLALTTVIYVAFRLLNPGWSLAYPLALKLAVPAGVTAGVLQGAAGISAPVSLTFVNAMGLERKAFIANVSILFSAMAVVQIPSLLSLGLLDVQKASLGLLACVALFGAMPAGAFIARFIARDTFDRLILLLLVVIALRLGWSVIGA